MHLFYFTWKSGERGLIEAGALKLEASDHVFKEPYTEHHVTVREFHTIHKNERMKF